MLVSAILEIYPEAMQEYPILKMEKNKGGKNKMDVREVQEKIKRNKGKISRNGADIADCEKEIEQLEKEIKELKQQGQSTYTQVLAKRLQIAELESEIIGIQSASDRLAKGIILADLQFIKKDGKQYQEHLYLSECYTNYYEVQNLEAVRESLELKMRIMVANKQQNSQEYRDLQEELKRNEQTLSMYRKSLDKAVQIYAAQGGKQGTDIDFSIPYTDVLEQYERESQVPNKTQNTNRKTLSDFGELSNDLINFTVGKYYQDREQEKLDIENNAKKVSIPIFTDGLEEEHKQLAEVYGEIYSEGIAKFATGKSDNSIFSKVNGVFSSVILLNRESNTYCLVYEREDGTQVGIPCTKNSETGKIEYYEDSRYKKDNDGFICHEAFEKISKNADIYPHITKEQMEMQVVKHNIERTMQDGKVTEIVEVTDSKIVQYLNQQNGLNKYSARDDASKVYMISRQDENGNSHYEFVAHNGSRGYTKLEGLQQVPNKQNSITIEGSRIPGQPTPMQRVDCTFVDKNGNSYYAYHQFEQGEMALSYSEHGKEDRDKVEVSKDSGLNKMLHNSRVRSLIRAGYNAMGIGYEKVKSIYHKFSGKDKENEVENEVENTRED